MNTNPAAINAILTAKMRNAILIAKEIEANAMSIAKEIGLVTGNLSLCSIAINLPVASSGRPDTIVDAAAATPTNANTSMHGYDIEGILDVEPHIMHHTVAFYGKLIPRFEEAPASFHVIEKSKYSTILTVHSSVFIKEKHCHLYSQCTPPYTTGTRLMQLLMPTPRGILLLCT